MSKKDIGGLRMLFNCPGFLIRTSAFRSVGRKWTFRECISTICYNKRANCSLGDFQRHFQDVNRKKI